MAIWLLGGPPLHTRFASAHPTVLRSLGPQAAYKDCLAAEKEDMLATLDDFMNFDDLSDVQQTIANTKVREYWNNEEKKAAGMAHKP